MSTPTTSPAPPGAIEGRGTGGRKEKQGQKKYYGRTAKVGAVWSILRQGGNELIGIPSSMIMARLLSPYEFGVAAASSFFIVLAARLTQFGFSAALIRLKDMRPEHASSVYIVNQTMGIMTFSVLFLVSPLIGQFFRSPEAGSLLRVAALTFVINPMSTVSSALLHRRMQFRYIALIDWADTLIGAVVTVVLAFRGFGFWSMVGGHLTALVIRVLLQLHLARWAPTMSFSRAALRELIPVGLGLQTKRLLEYAATNLDNLVVGRVLGMAGLGIYDKAFTTMNKLVVRLTLGQAPFRIFSIIHEDAERFRRAYSRLILSITLLGYPVLVGCVVAAEPLFLVLYGEKWTSAVFPFQLLCAGGLLKLLNAYASQANEAAGNVWPQVRRQAFGTVLVVVGAGLGSLYWGVPGAALGVLMATIVLTVAMQALVREATGLSWSAMFIPQLPGVTCAVLLAGVLLATDAGLRAVLPEAQAWRLLLAQTMTGALFYAIFVLFGPFTAVRDLVSETLDELLPPGAARALNRVRGLTLGKQS
jgi:PST family polysaccharide transporter